MEKLIVLGTGNALATRCYNTCFAIDDGEGHHFLVDAGGGNGILRQLEDAHIPLETIHAMHVTHAHCDHILGVVWMIRAIGTKIKAGGYEPPFDIITRAERIPEIVRMCEITLEKKFCDLLGHEIRLIPIDNHVCKPVYGYEVEFFDIHSTKAPQTGFTLRLHNGRKLTCLGDEPYNPLCEAYVAGSDWMLCEAFCLYGDRERFKPYEKHHSTVKDAGELAESLGIPHLVLWHTEDKTIATRKAAYTAECKRYYSGDVHVPDDLEVIQL